MSTISFLRRQIEGNSTSYEGKSKAKSKDNMALLRQSKAVEGSGRKVPKTFFKKDKVYLIF